LLPPFLSVARIAPRANMADTQLESADDVKSGSKVADIVPAHVEKDEFVVYKAWRILSYWWSTAILIFAIVVLYYDVRILFPPCRHTRQVLSFVTPPPHTYLSLILPLHACSFSRMQDAPPSPAPVPLEFECMPWTVCVCIVCLQKSTHSGCWVWLLRVGFV
jgi:hypothetical protein